MTRMTRIFPTLLASTFLSLGLFSSAQAGTGDAAERRQNRTERIDNAADSGDDLVDRGELLAIIDAWHSARADGDRAAERRADRRLEAWIVRELRENNREVLEAKAEVAASSAEVARSRRERNRAARHGRVYKTADSGRDLRDDRADRADDVRDLAVVEADRRRTRQIARELRGLQPRFETNRASGSLYRQKSALLDELRVLAAAEVSRNSRERREDRRERGEDRWERRERR